MKGFCLFILIGFSHLLYGQNAQNDSSLNGKYIVYKEGKVSVDAYYKDQKRHKIWTWYFEDGSINKKTKYKKGKAIWTIYYEENKVWLKVNRFGKRRVIRPCKCRERDL